MSTRAISLTGGVSSTVPVPTAVQTTYHNLIEFHLHRVDIQLIEDGSSTKARRQVSRNHRTAINGWLKEKQIEKHFPTGDELGCDFKLSLDDHLNYLKNKKGLSNSTIRSRKTLLCQWAESRLEMSKAQELPGTFNEALRFLVEESNLSYWSIAKKVNVATSTFYGWVFCNKIPSSKQRESVLRTEEFFDLQANTLVSRLGEFRWHRKPHQSGVTTYGKRLQRQLKEKYYLNDFSPFPALQAEWNSLVKFMSAPYVAEGKQRNSRWKGSIDNNPTAQYHKSMLSCFYGFLCLPDEGSVDLRGKGLKPRALTLALLSNTNLVEDFIEFRRARSGGIYTHYTLRFLTFCCSALRKDTGYLRQHSEFGRRLTPPVPADEWDAHCGKAHERFRSVVRELQKNGLIRYGRDVEEPIRAILDRDHPIHALFELIDNIEAARPLSTERVRLATHSRDLLLLKLLTANPLRIKHFSMMCYRGDNSGNLFQREDKSWWLRYKLEDFKNFKFVGSDQRDYVAPLPESLWKDIEEYLLVHRPQLVGAAECDYVFRPSFAGAYRRRDLTNPVPPTCLSASIGRLSQRYLPDCPGFRAHAIRHIIATEYIKNNPDGFEVAARILHDKVETVRKAYAHLRTADYFAYWLRYYECQRKEAHQL